jgi:signal transduction histidine kinase
MSLRVRLAAILALVALLTALAIALTAPAIIGGGFARLQADETPPGNGGPGPGGPGPGPMAGVHAAQIQRETTDTIIAVAAAAAAGASMLGFAIAGWVTAPLRRLEAAAASIARGDLDQRSGLAGRRDEIGSLGRSFDAMAADLAAADASRRRLFQDVAHELKTPLAVIAATATAILDGVYPDEPGHLETIRTQSRILSRIVDDLRTISLAEAGHLPLGRTPLDLGSVVGPVIASFAARAASAGVRLERGPVGPLSVVADRERLEQILNALLDNALRHTPAGGSVVVSAVPRDGGLVRLSVADTGPGVAAADAPRVFDRFYRADQARDRTVGSTGLGLAIVRALAVAQDGSAGLDPTPGGGATFWVDLPRAPA